MFHAVVPAAFQHVEEAGHVAGHIDMRVGRGVPHAGLGGQIDHALGSMGGESLFHCRPVGQIDGQLDEVGMIEVACETSALQLGIIIVIEAVDADYPVATLQEPQTGGRTDESGAAGDHHFHGTAPDRPGQGPLTVGRRPPGAARRT